MQFTGERWIPGEVEERVEKDHRERYIFALNCSNRRHVLDIACGAGGGSHLLATEGRAASVVGVDIFSDAIDYARQRYTAPNLRYEVGDILSYSPDKSFDLITCFETIEHVSEDRISLRNLRSWLAPNGVLLISSPNRPITSPTADSIDDPPIQPFHVREYVPSELRDRLANAGFKHLRTYGQRLRWHFPSGRVVGLMNFARRAFGLNPDSQSPATVRRFYLRAPRHFLIAARA